MEKMERLALRYLLIGKQVRFWNTHRRPRKDGLVDNYVTFESTSARMDLGGHWSGTSATAGRHDNPGGGSDSSRRLVIQHACRYSR